MRTKLIMLLVAFIMVLSIVGCNKYRQAGVTRNQQSEDHFNCEMKCLPAKYPAGRVLLYYECFTRCMKEKGYSR